MASKRRPSRLRRSRRRVPRRFNRNMPNRGRNVRRQPSSLHQSQAMESYLSSVLSWWVFGLRRANVIVGFILTHLGSEEWQTEIRKKPELSGYRQVLDQGLSRVGVPIGVSNRVAVSIHNLIKHAPFLNGSYPSVSVNAPFPYNGTLKPEYAVAKYSRYRVSSYLV